MQQGQANKKHKKSQVKIEFTPKFITSWGKTAGMKLYGWESLIKSDGQCSQMCLID